MRLAPVGILRMREAVKALVLTKFSYRIDKGYYDKGITQFLNGDTISIDMSLILIPNDILLMTALAGNEVTDEVKSKVQAMWEREGKEGFE